MNTEYNEELRVIIEDDEHAGFVRILIGIEGNDEKKDLIRKAFYRFADEVQEIISSMHQSRVNEESGCPRFEKGFVEGYRPMNKTTGYCIFRNEDLGGHC